MTTINELIENTLLTEFPPSRALYNAATTIGEEDDLPFRSTRSVSPTEMNQLSSSIVRLLEELNTYWGKWYWPSSPITPQRSKRIVLISSQPFEEQLRYPEDTAASEIPWSVLWSDLEEYYSPAERLFPLIPSRKNLFSKEIEFTTSELPRLKPTITHLRPSIENDDE